MAGYTYYKVIDIRKMAASRVWIYRGYHGKDSMEFRSRSRKWEYSCYRLHEVKNRKDFEPITEEEAFLELL